MNTNNSKKRKESNPRLAAKIKAMDYLARRDHSEKELREKLGKNFSQEIVESVIEECKNSMWMSPPEELAERVAMSLNRKLKSHFYINSYLAKKGLPGVQFARLSEKDKALAIIEKYAQDDWDYQDLFRLLKNRGFDKDTIKQAIGESLNNKPNS